MSDNDQVVELRSALAAAEGERDAWKDTAAQYARNVEFYRGIVRRCGAAFGEAARTADDGSVAEDVLALKVPELVEEAVRRLDDNQEADRG